MCSSSPPTTQHPHPPQFGKVVNPLCNVEEQEGHHEGEQTSGLSEGETKNGILEELTTEGWVAGDTLDETTEYSSDTNTGTSKTNGGDTGTLDLSGGDHGSCGRLGDDAALLHSVADHVLGEGIADEAVLCWLEASYMARKCVSNAPEAQLMPLMMDWSSNGWGMWMVVALKNIPAVDTERLCWTERAAMRATPAFIRAIDMMTVCWRCEEMSGDELALIWTAWCWMLSGCFRRREVEKRRSRERMEARLGPCGCWSKQAAFSRMCPTLS